MYVATGRDTPPLPNPATTDVAAAAAGSHNATMAPNAAAAAAANAEAVDAATLAVFVNNRREALKSFCSDGEIEDEEVVSLIPSFKECVEQIFPAVKNESNESLEVLPSFEGGEKTVNLR